MRSKKKWKKWQKSGKNAIFSPPGGQKCTMDKGTFSKMFSKLIDKTISNPYEVREVNPPGPQSFCVILFEEKKFYEKNEK